MAQNVKDSAQNGKAGLTAHRLGGFNRLGLAGARLPCVRLRQGRSCRKAAIASGRSLEAAWPGVASPAPRPLAEGLPVAGAWYLRKPIHPGPSKLPGAGLRDVLSPFRVKRQAVTVFRDWRGLRKTGTHLVAVERSGTALESSAHPCLLLAWCR